MAQKRKRTPGAGRKASGPFKENSVQLTVRMRKDIRDQLEEAAAKQGHSLSQELQSRLLVSFRQDSHENYRDAPTNALSFLISEAAHRVHLRMPINWNFDPFLFKAFRLAVAKLLEALQPVGEIESPLSKFPAKAISALDFELQVVSNRWNTTPENLAERVANSIFDSLQAAEGDKKAQMNDLLGKDEQIIKQFEREFYDMAHAKRDLGIQFVKSKEPKS